MRARSGGRGPTSRAGPLYFIFHIQTRAHYFMQTLLAGGATYRATGRGFVTTHNAFDEQSARGVESAL